MAAIFSTTITRRFRKNTPSFFEAPLFDVSCLLDSTIGLVVKLGMRMVGIFGAEFIFSCVGGEDFCESLCMILTSAKLKSRCFETVKLDDGS